MHKVLGFGLKSRQLVLREQITQGLRNWKFSFVYFCRMWSWAIRSETTRKKVRYKGSLLQI